MRLISTADIREKMTWEKAVTALFRGHQGTRPKVQDILLEDGPFSLFGRGVILPGYGAGLKVADGPELTRWKTAADSALGSRLLSRGHCQSKLA